MRPTRRERARTSRSVGRIAADLTASEPPEVPPVSDAKPTIFHNPHCSKSRGAKDILEGAGVEFELVEYLKAPPTKADLERIVDMLEDPPEALVRTGDAKFKDLGLEKSFYTDKESVVALLVEHPELMERPVVVVGDRAVIGRPPERVNELL
jgi:arsenate reductase